MAYDQREAPLSQAPVTHFGHDICNRPAKKLRFFGAAAMKTGIQWVIAGVLGVTACGQPGDMRMSMEAVKINAYEAKLKLSNPAVSSDAWVILNSCLATRGKTRWSWQDYRTLLDVLRQSRFVVVPLRDYATAVVQYPDRVVVAMRHDLDGNLCRANEMARIEKSVGIHSTYFVNHNDGYYGWGWGKDYHHRQAELYRYREIQALGHGFVVG